MSIIPRFSLANFTQSLVGFQRRKKILIDTFQYNIWGERNNRHENEAQPEKSSFENDLHHSCHCCSKVDSQYPNVTVDNEKNIPGYNGAPNALETKL